MSLPGFVDCPTCGGEGIEDGVKEWYRDQARAALLEYARHV